MRAFCPPAVIGQHLPSGEAWGAFAAAEACSRRVIAQLRVGQASCRLPGRKMAVALGEVDRDRWVSRQGGLDLN